MVVLLLKLGRVLHLLIVRITKFHLRFCACAVKVNLNLISVDIKILKSGLELVLLLVLSQIWHTLGNAYTLVSFELIFPVLFELLLNEPSKGFDRHFAELVESCKWATVGIVVDLVATRKRLVLNVLSNNLKHVFESRCFVKLTRSLL